MKLAATARRDSDLGGGAPGQATLLGPEGEGPLLAMDQTTCAGGGLRARAAAAQAEAASKGKAWGRAQIHTPEFRAWFRDSKVVDAAGQPLVVYHGTNRVFESFRPLSYFSEDPREAVGYALKEGTLESAIAEWRRYRFVSPEGLEIPGPFKGHEVHPCLQDYVGEDGVVYPCEDGLAYRQGSRYFILTGLKLEWEPWPPAGVDVDAMHPWERMNLALHQTVKVQPGTSDLETDFRAEIRQMAEEASKDCPGVMPVYLSMRNPYRTSDQLYAAQFLQCMQEWVPREGATPAVDVAVEVARLKALGHDGIIAPSDGVRLANAFGEGPGHDVMNYLVFEPTQVKSAVGNCGAFDPMTGDITG